MASATKRLADRFLKGTGLCYFPVRVRAGFSKGARWTLYPWSAYWRGGFEPSLQKALEDLGDMTGWSCWDLGAHYGIYSVGLARRVGPTGQVLALEPNPLSFARLARHKRMNGLHWLNAVQAGASETEGSGAMLTYGELESSTTHLAYVGETLDDSTRPLPIALIKLDAWVREGKCRPPRFIKMDVEGHGAQVLKGAEETLRAHKPTLIVALHYPLEIEGVHRILDPLGYSVTKIGSHGGGTEGEGDFLFRPPSV